MHQGGSIVLKKRGPEITEKKSQGDDPLCVGEIAIREDRVEEKGMSGRGSQKEEVSRSNDMS